jgi:hypothetical protein
MSFLEREEEHRLSEHILPEFYELSFLNSSATDNKSVASIALSTRSAKIKHEEIVRKKKSASKRSVLTIPDRVLENMRVSERKLFSRGHCVPLPGSPISKRPLGSSPIVLRNEEMGSVGRNISTFRPQTAGDEYATRTGRLTTAQMTRRKTTDKYVRRTQRMVLNCGGQPIAEDCSRSSWAFKKPLDRIMYERPSTVGSSLAYAPVPDCAEAILIDGSYGTLAGAAKQRINEKTTKQDKLYLIAQRPKTPSMGFLRAPLPDNLVGGAPFKLKDAPTGREKPCWRKSCLK